jgi:hypothetical protein
VDDAIFFQFPELGCKHGLRNAGYLAAQFAEPRRGPEPDGIDDHWLPLAPNYTHGSSHGTTKFVKRTIFL